MRPPIFIKTIFIILIISNINLNVQATGYQEITIGVISSTTSGLESVEVVSQIAIQDINKFMETYGFPYRFKTIIKDSAGQAAVHLTHVQSLLNEGVKIIVGGRGSSQAAASLSYMNDNGMLLLSPSSTSPLLAIPGDNFFRTCPTDVVQSSVISQMLVTAGKKYIVAIQRGDAWADGIWNHFQPNFESSGGVILERIRYAGEATEFANYLMTAENIMKAAANQYGLEKCAVMVLSFNEIVTMVTQSEDFPTIYNVPWFGSDGTALTQQAIDDAPTQANKLKLFSPLAAPANSELFTNLYDKYWTLRLQSLGFYSACDYDAYWLIALSVVAAGSAEPLSVKKVLPSVAERWFGASGHCKLDENGDRYYANYQIWGVEGNRWKIVGYYNAPLNEVIWSSDINSVPIDDYENALLINPKYGASLQNPVTFQCLVIDKLGQALRNSRVSFVLDGTQTSSANTDSMGIASISVNVNEGIHSLYAYTSNSISSQSNNPYTFTVTGSSSSSSVWLWLTVQDSSGTPISEASVYWDGSYLGSTSSDGRVKIYTNYPPAIHSWSASKNGYDSKSDNVEIGSTSGGGFTVTLVKRYTSSPSTSYSNQCELGIDSSLGVVSGYGKYLKGTTVSFQVTPTTIDISTGVRYAFIGWSSYSPGGYNGNNNPATVKLDNDIFEIANWETQCWLEIDGGGGYTSCDSGWYKKGGLVNIEAFPLSNPIIIYHFNGWEGIPNTQTTALVQVDGPMNVRAVWSEDYSRVYMLGGFALAGSMILVFRKRSISKREFEKQVQLNKEKTVYNIIASSKAIINLNELANEVGLSEDQIRSIIEKFLAEGKVLGYYNATNNMFITNEYIRSYITEKITHSQT